MTDKIEEVCRKYKRPAATKLFQLAKSEGVPVTLKQVKEFLGGRVEEQQLKETKNVKYQHGHLVFFNSFNRLHLDTFVLQKYESSNNGYCYILCLMDIFNRKATYESDPKTGRPGYPAVQLCLTSHQ